MHRLSAFLIALLLGAAPSFGQSVVKTETVRAELISEAATVKPGEPFWVGLRETIKPKWHTYWKNPGDAGQPTDIKWTLPAGVTADPIVWPAPTLNDVGGIINYGYHDDVLLPVTVYPEDRKAPVNVRLHVTYAACREVCVLDAGGPTAESAARTAAGSSSKPYGCWKRFPSPR